MSGEFISNSKNVHLSYYIDDGENEKYAVRGGVGQKDTLDVFGVHSGELCYESNNIDFSSRSLFCVNGQNHIDTNYVIDSFNVEHAFGCISVNKKKNCILNKQYGEKEFSELKERIIHQMSEMPYKDSRGLIYGYGEFYPIEIAPFSYNRSLAQEYVPVTKENALETGYQWSDFDEKEYEASIKGKDLSDTIKEVDDSILSEIILCEAWDNDKEVAQEHKCSKAFRITRNELSVYKKFGMPLPRKCPNTRNYEIFKLRNPVEFYHRQCMCDYQIYNNTTTHEHHKEGKCPNEFETSYSPERKEIVYCEKCYQAEVI